jgi:hypothetical protein
MPIFGSTFILRIVEVMAAFVIAAIIVFTLAWLFFTVTRVWYDHMERNNSEFWQWLKTKLPRRKRRTRKAKV